MSAATTDTDLATDQQARRVVTAVTLCLLADAMRARLHERGPGCSDADVARVLEFALVETQVRTGARVPILVA